MRIKVARARQLLYYMKNQFTNGIYSNKAKLDYMQLMYKKEIDAYRTEIAKSKDKKIKEMMKPLGLIDGKQPVALFKLIIYRAKIMHSLAFFQWRLTNVPTCHKEDIKEIFESKSTYLKNCVTQKNKKEMMAVLEEATIQ